MSDTTTMITFCETDGSDVAMEVESQAVPRVGDDFVVYDDNDEQHYTVIAVSWRHNVSSKAQRSVVLRAVVYVARTRAS